MSSWISTKLQNLSSQLRSGYNYNTYPGRRLHSDLTFGYSQENFIGQLPAVVDRASVSPGSIDLPNQIVFAFLTLLRVKLPACLRSWMHAVAMIPIVLPDWVILLTSALHGDMSRCPFGLRLHVLLLTRVCARKDTGPLPLNLDASGHGSLRA
ncbi:hypothetical protein A0H81_11014 [Grifola frondosa]|uniref:Uncharacterized protein n=1 Tax=Grifola frondosa TaxID=5627 RepID=A0A1C7LVL0_GRIFR|nr:hypothetical protein A0H81_11014 [Grifola frondosa]